MLFALEMTKLFQAIFPFMAIVKWRTEKICEIEMREADFHQKSFCDTLSLSVVLCMVLVDV